MASGAQAIGGKLLRFQQRIKLDTKSSVTASLRRRVRALCLLWYALPRSSTHATEQKVERMAGSVSLSLGE
jgi:hypothetical protein